MIRGSDDLLALPALPALPAPPPPVTPSPEESVDRRETRRLGRDDDDVASDVAALLLFLSGVAAGTPVAAAAAAAGWMTETAAAAELAPAGSEDPGAAGCMRGKGSLVLTSLTPLSLLPLSFDFLVLPVAIPECG